MKTAVENESQTVAQFFSITQDQLARALATPWQIVNYLERERNSPKTCSADPSALEARRLHNLLLLAYAMQESDCIPLDKCIFLAGEAASEVSAKAVVAAMDKGQLKELSAVLNRIKERAGLTRQLGWMNGDGPADYEQASDQFCDLLLKINDTITVEVFRRYRLNAALELYQENSLRFHEMFYKGQKHFRVASRKAAPKPRVEVKESPHAIQIMEQGLRMANLALGRIRSRAPLDYCI
jgi:hypothetical protein